MKRLFLWGLVVSVLITAAALSRNQGTPSGDLQVEVEDRNPWTHLRLNNDPSDFQFVVISDRTGGHRPRVFSQAVEQINLLQPEFVLSVGDLIEGYSQDDKRITDEWKEFQSYVCRLQMPFFYVPGNHDVTNKFQEKVWKEKFGRRYYHFTYRGVFFLLLNSELTGEKDASGLDAEQIAWAKKVLEENKNVRWTIVSLHKPLWAYPNLEKNGWLDVEKALTGRNYTVFAGHVHRYQKFVRNGMRYYQLATTGGGSRMRGVEYGEFDHVVWVTMKKDGPLLANIMLGGVYPEDLKAPISDEQGVPEYNRKACQPAVGKVFFEGCPTPGAQVVFHLVNPETKKLSRAADALVESDGSFTLSAYKAFDGAPAGTYQVSITWNRPRFDEQGKPGPNFLPEKYAKPDTSGLEAVVKSGKNEFSFDLKR